MKGIADMSEEAISPANAACLMDIDIRQQAESAVSGINHHLSDNWYTGRTDKVYIPQSLIPKHKKAREMVKTLFEAKGWVITETSDQRDGYSWAFDIK
jgi:hypothetical protein